MRHQTTVVYEDGVSARCITCGWESERWPYEDEDGSLKAREAAEDHRVEHEGEQGRD